MLDRKTVLEAFQRLSAYLSEAGVVGEIALLGGTAMMMAFQARQATKDVDAIFAPTREVRDAAKRVAADLGLNEDWLNDSAKGFLSARGDFSEQGLPQYSHLRILSPTPEYMLAMKVLSARVAVGTDPGDKGDIALLMKRLGLKTNQEVMNIVCRYYEDARILPRSAYLVDEILEEMRRT